jgi:hypothetical protein
MIKRIIFEVLFLILLPTLLLWNFTWAFFLLVRECGRVYPNEIYEFTKGIVYGKEDS